MMQSPKNPVDLERRRRSLYHIYHIALPPSDRSFFLHLVLFAGTEALISNTDDLQVTGVYCLFNCSLL